MAIEFNCHVCGKLLRTSDDKAGRTAKCPGCGESLEVPQGEFDSADENLANDSQDDEADSGDDTVVHLSLIDPRYRFTVGGGVTLMGASYYWFFSLLALATAIIFIFVAILYQSRTHMQEELPADAVDVSMAEN